MFYGVLEIDHEDEQAVEIARNEVTNTEERPSLHIMILESFETPPPLHLKLREV